MNKVISSLLGVLLLIVAGPSQAILIEAVPTSSQVSLGNQAIVDINVSGLGANTAPSLGVFDIDVGFDPAILNVANVAFGSGLDVLGLGSIQAVDTSISGLVNLFELSLDSVADLDDLQPASFTLATLTFDTLALGVSSIGINVNALGDAFGDSLEAVSYGTSVAAVPEAPALMLTIIGIIALFLTMQRRRFTAEGDL